MCLKAALEDGQKAQDCAQLFASGFVGGDGRLEPMLGYAFELHVAGKPGDEVVY